MLSAAQVLAIVLLPLAVLAVVSRSRLLRGLGAVAVCYALGFVLAALPLPYDKALASELASYVVIVAIPLILFSFDLRRLRELARPLLIACLLNAACICLLGLLYTALLRDKLPFAAQLSAMCAGLYTGGTPNLVAIGQALLGRGGGELISAANTADILVGGVYFLLLVTLLRRCYRWGAAPAAEQEAEISSAADEYRLGWSLRVRADRRALLRLLAVCGLALLCVGIGVALELAINHDLSGSLYIIVSVSLLGVAASLWRPVRETRGSYQLGQYLILVFSLALSMSIDWALLQRQLLPMIGFFALMQLSTALLHGLCCRLLRLDGATAMITSVAGIYGPPFIPPAAASLRRADLIPGGVLCGVLGLAGGEFSRIGYVSAAADVVGVGMDACRPGLSLTPVILSAAKDLVP